MRWRAHSPFSKVSNALVKALILVSIALLGLSQIFTSYSKSYLALRGRRKVSNKICKTKYRMEDFYFIAMCYNIIY